MRIFSICDSFESPYSHRFVSGDACGLYVVKGEELIVSNAKFEAEVSGEDIRWVPADGSIDIVHNEGNVYFLYYPLHTVRTAIWMVRLTGGMPQAVNDTGIFITLAFMDKDVTENVIYPTGPSNRHCHCGTCPGQSA